LPHQKYYKDSNFQILLGVTLMAVLGVASISPAFPRIVEALNISETEVGMLIVVFTIPGVILTPFVGILADRAGRKRIMVPSLFLFGLAGGACTLVTKFDILLALRLLQGIGGAALASLSLTVIGDLFQGEQRTAAIGLNTSVANLGVAGYPLLGGALTTLAWNYPFLLPLFAIPIGLIVLFRLNNPEPRSRESLREYLGSAWSYFKNIKVASTFMAGVIILVIHYGVYLTYFSLYLKASFQTSSFIIGVILSSISITAALVASQMGKITRLTSAPDLIKLGFVLQAVSLAMIPFYPRVELMLISTFILGLAMGVFLPSLVTYISGVAPMQYRAVMMSLNSTMLRLGQTLGPLVFGLVYIRTSFDGVFFYGAGLALFAAIIGFVGGKMIS
jgi:ACDE family multidrug resistance protein